MMTIRKAMSRLDWSIFLTRWVLVVGVAIFALAMPGLHQGEAGETARDTMLLAVGLGVLVALVGAGLAAWASDSLAPGLVGMLIDTAYALFLFWASAGEPLILLVAGALPIINGALRLGGFYGLVAAVLLAVGGVVLHQLTLVPTVDILTADGVMIAVALLLMAAYIGIPTALASLGWVGQQLRLQERETEAAQLRAARERARAVYEMASTLSATLNFKSVLDAALDVGVLGLRKIAPGQRLVSAVFLFDENTGQLKVANSRRLTRADQDKQVPGRMGVLGLALQHAEPVFASDPRRDPELQYFVGFQDARSILCVPLRAGFNSYGALVFGSTTPNAFSEEHEELLTAIASQAAIALQNAMLYHNLLEERERIIQAEDNARKQLSRNLHDGPVQDVSSIAMRANFINRLLEREPDQAPAEIQKIEEIARQTVKQMRQMLFTLRPLILETQGLKAALEELGKKMRETDGQNVLVQIDGGVERYIDARDQTVVFNIVDEAVNNARKHAEAEHIWVRLNRQEDYLWLEIEDDGVGFDKGDVDASYDTRGSLGMVNLRERAELLDGTLRIETAEGKGTKIAVLAPIRETILKEIRAQDNQAGPDKKKKARPGPSADRSSGQVIRASEAASSPAENK